MVIVSIICLALVAYTYVGYPLLIVVCGRLFRHRPEVDRAWQPHVSVCIAVYNGADYLPAKLDSVLAMDYPADKLEVLVCSDASTDDTDAIVNRCADTDPRVRLLRNDTRVGKPTALNRMRDAARGEVLLMTDVRQRLSANAAAELVSHLAPASVGCVSGALQLEGDTGARLYWRYELAIRRNEGRFRGLVGVTGALYAVRKADVEPLPADTVLDDMWIPLKLRLRGRRILLHEGAVAYDRAYEDKREFGRKVRTLFGNYQLYSRLPRLLVPFVSRAWLEIVSHKVMRLLCPWLLIALLATSATVAAAGDVGDTLRALFVVLVAGQALVYALAAVGRRAGKLGGVARTFVVLNAAAVVGLWQFVSRKNKVTW